MLFPFLSTHREYWCLDKDSITWSIFLLFINEYNTAHTLLKVAYLLLDVSMVHSDQNNKIWGLPKITYVPRNQVELETLTRNGVEGVNFCSS